MNPSTKFRSRLLDRFHLSEHSYVLRFERKGLSFLAGQYIVIGIPDQFLSREYSIYSGENDDYLEVLIREVDGGDLSPLLKEIPLGTEVEIQGPFGFFILNEEEVQNMNFRFIATGTGISPFRSFLRTRSDINAQILHGIRNTTEKIRDKHYELQSTSYCTSQDESGNFNGRVTKYLQAREINTDELYYLCGNSEMIHEVTDILEEAGVEPENIRSEVFF